MFLTGAQVSATGVISAHFVSFGTKRPPRRKPERPTGLVLFQFPQFDLACLFVKPQITVIAGGLDVT